MTPFGDHALRFPVPEGASHAALFAALRKISGVTDVVLAESIGMTVGGDAAAIAEALRATSPADAPASRLHVVDVIYDGQDLAEVAARTALAREEVIRAHTDREHVVAMLGFLPGFAYLRGVDPRLAPLPRRESPRTRVPAGSVAIAAGYTGIYPCASPGGWHLLGRAPSFTAFGDAGATLAAGDRVRFRAADAIAEAAAPRPERPPVHGPHLVLSRVAGPALLVDGGRTGHMHEGVPVGGPLVPEALERANAALGNAPGACAIELYGAVEVTAVGGAITLADDRIGAIVLRDGEQATVATAGEVRARYLAVAGGFDVPLVLGGRGTLLVAGLGGLDGRALRRGDTLAPLGEGAQVRPRPLHVPEPDPGPIPITLGPDPAPAATIDALTSAPFHISHASDRTGTRLDGPALATSRVERASAPMVCGAIELTPRGLIVLGPDHPTTGGYPVVAVVRHAAIGRLFARPVGSEVRFMVDTSPG